MISVMEVSASLLKVFVGIEDWRWKVLDKDRFFKSPAERHIPTNNWSV